MIQIINGFKINSKHPVDSRIIVDDEATRLAILYKYHGLRVWQTDTNTPYFWDGTDWKSELDLVVTGEDGDVTVGNVPVFTSSDPVKIGDSIISVSSGLVTIDGELRFDSITSGSINADLIDTGNMSIDRLTPGSNNQVLRTNSSGIIEWTNLSGLTIGNSTNSNNSNNLKIKTINLSDTYQLVLRNESSTISSDGNYVSLHSHVNGLKFKDDGNGLRILAHNGSSSNPPYSFHSATEDTTNTYNTGMYRPANNEIGFSIAGQQAVRITSSYINFGIDSEGSPRIRTGNNTSPTTPSYTWYGNDQTGMYRPDQDVIGFGIAGQQTVRITSSYINFGLSSTGTPIIKNNSGDVGSPSYTWYGDSNTGIYRPSDAVIGFTVDGVERGRFNSSGLVVTGSNSGDGFLVKRGTTDVFKIQDTGLVSVVSRKFSVGGDFDTPGQLYRFGSSNSGVVINKSDLLTPVATFDDDIVLSGENTTINGKVQMVDTQFSYLKSNVSVPDDGGTIRYRVSQTQSSSDPLNPVATSFDGFSWDSDIIVTITPRGFGDTGPDIRWWALYVQTTGDDAPISYSGGSNDNGVRSSSGLWGIIPSGRRWYFDISRPDGNWGFAIGIRRIGRLS